MNGAAIVFSLVLLLSIAWAEVVARAARAHVRSYLHFSCVLYVALALSRLVPTDAAMAAPFVYAVALVVCVLGASTLCFALIATFRGRQSLAAEVIALPLACLGGIAAAATGVVAFGLVPLAGVAVATAFISARSYGRFGVASLEGFAASTAFIAAGASLMARGFAADAALDLFSAAGVLGSALALARSSDPPVEQQRRRRLPHVLAVREKR